MDSFKDKLKQLSSRVRLKKESVKGEAATKNAFILPFLQILGYDLTDTSEVAPEYTCDIGTKKGEKVDYAILRDGEPIILIECKNCEQDLNNDKHEQLLRYFSVSTAKFGILTNGIKYLFYSDIEDTNKMDKESFLDIDFENLNDSAIEEVKKFSKSNFNSSAIRKAAKKLKDIKKLKAFINSEIKNPSKNFMKFLAKQVGIPERKLPDITNLIDEIIFERPPQSTPNTEKPEKAASEKPSPEKKQRKTLAVANIRKGEELSFYDKEGNPRNGETVIVMDADKNKVLLNGREIKISGAAKELLGRGTDEHSVWGIGYFKYKGKLITEILGIKHR